MNTLEEKIILKIRQFFALLKALGDQMERSGRNRRDLLRRVKERKS